jgi:hypothetical protein
VTIDKRHALTLGGLLGKIDLTVKAERQAVQHGNMATWQSREIPEGRLSFG